MNIFILVLILIAVLWLCQVIDAYRKGLPPGPLRLPGIGCILQVLLVDYKLPPVAFHKLRKLYGDVMSIQTGTVFFGKLVKYYKQGNLIRTLSLVHAFSCGKRLRENS